MNIMIKHVLFIHGAGSGAYEEDGLLVDRLQEKLGSAYTIHYPAMTDESNAPYAVWKKQVEDVMNGVKAPIILVGHSIGASHLAKMLTEIKIRVQISGVFLLEAPFWGGEGWRYEGYKELELPGNASAKFPKGVKVFIYHTRDDEIVPFNHLNLYAKLLPQANVRSIDTGGHQLSDDLSLLVEDIKSLGID